jgi:hypothetical protein
MKKRSIGMSCAALAIAATAVVGAAPANAAGCATGSAQIWQAYNQNCSWAQHYDIVGGSVYKYAPKVSPQVWSKQAVCWANVTGYGVLKSNVAVTYS